MEGPFINRIKGKRDSQAPLNNSMTHPRVRLNHLNEKARIEASKKSEEKTENSEFQRQAILYLIHELELRLGFPIPKENLKQASDTIKDRLSFKIVCSITDLLIFSNKIEKLLQELETFPCKQWKIELAGHVFELDINDSDSGLSKDKLIENFTLSRPSSSPSELIIPASVINLCQDYEESLQTAFDSHREFSALESPHKYSKKSLFLIKSEIEESSRRKQEYLSLKQDLQWQREELKFVVSQAKHQKNENASKETLLDAQLANLRVRRIALAQEHENVELQQGKINAQKQVIRSICIQLGKFLNHFDSKPAAENKNITGEVNILENQLRELEAKQKRSSGQEVDSVITQINRIKTKISSLKTVQVMNASTYSNCSTKNIIHSINHVYPNKETPKGSSMLSSPYHSSLRIKIPKVDLTAFSFSTLRTERSLSIGQMPYEQKDESGSSSEMLKLRELRLIQKEEELNFIEDKIINKLGNGDKINDIKVLRAETARLKKRLENKQKVLEGEYEDMEKVKQRVRELENEAEKKVMEVDIEGMKVVEEKARMAKILEEIKEYLQVKIAEIN